ncbi:(Fe-S)-binding protein [Labilibaculum manganireducens]|uniref:(Fe-S)-binding protein n=1 Tax=Labilibaculum manganireducens TaxID=1940525 RepID=UPI0029F51426|nr:(Fe-S)-binding protein [Labilibaculum manganireducens]
MEKKIIEFLPGFNCGRCGFGSCTDFAEAIEIKPSSLDLCPFLTQERFIANKIEIERLAMGEPNGCQKKTVGVIDAYEADIVLDPLKGEISCREVLMPMSLVNLQIGEVIEYRPLGCPIVHYGKVIKIDHLLVTVHLIGPCRRRESETKFTSVGCCMVIAFEGRFHGKNVKVGETVRFLPKHCMMQKVHSGVVVKIEDENILIEGIDLKVWQPPVVCSMK